MVILEFIRLNFTAIAAGIFGAVFGSFLNVVIYRLPISMRVDRPKRSFCPKCERTLTWYENIPVLSWVIQKAKCRGCGARIPVRYPVVELLTALGFCYLFHTQSPAVALVFSLFWILLICATFIDFDHLIIPHSINFGGAVLGLITSFLIPQIHDQIPHLNGLLKSIIGGLAGLLLLGAVVHLGKLAFGKRKETFDKPEPWKIHQPNPEESPVFEIDDVKIDWWDLFFRKTDRLEIDAQQIKIKTNNESSPSKTHTAKKSKITVWEDRIQVTEIDNQKEKTWLIEQIKKISGTTTEVVIPREAMGHGDIWFLMMIGTFLGWKGVLFTVIAASIYGSIAGLVPRLFGKSDWFNRIPFGPYLALGAVTWYLKGQELLTWYMGLFNNFN